MKYSYRWLKDLSGTKKSPEALANLLIQHAFEVESLEKRVAGLDNVVVGEVMKLEKHPNAGKLRVAEVKIGKTTSTVVCGAPNVAVGQKVAVALPGALLPGGRRIEEAEIRGVTSHGMICSGQELGLNDDQSGILVLPDDVSSGTLFAKHFGLDDTILDVKILPDRGSDALSYQGLAREIAALDGRAPAFVSERPKAISIPAYNRAPKISLQDKKACRRYVGVLIQNVTIGPSPLWLQVRLLLSGLRPKNNVIDVTNYLMLLFGQPLHAFDADLLKGHITVRRAKRNERLELLNGETVKLDPEDLVIADEKAALALAGVMGGAKTAIRETTKNVFLEIASFDPGAVRRSKTRHGVLSDAAYRFERNVNPELPPIVAREAARLAATLSGGRIMGLRDVGSGKYPSRTIMLSQGLVEKVLGIEIPLFVLVRSLALLGLKVKKIASKDVIRVTVGTRRPDLSDEWDLIEEIGRMYGYDKIAPTPPTALLAPPEENPKKRLERELKKSLSSRGFDEIMTYSFYGKRDLESASLPLAQHALLENPMNPDQEYLRASLLPNILRKLRENARHFHEVRLFELGSVFWLEKKSLSEEKNLGLGVMIEEKERGESFRLLKGKIEALFEDLGLPLPEAVRLKEKEDISTLGLFHRTRAALLVCQGKTIGVFGELSPLTRRKYSLPEGVAVAELLLEKVGALERKENVFRELQRYPYALRDISLRFSKKVPVAEVEAVLQEAGAPLLKRHELFDIYEQGEEKNLAFHLYFGLSERTITSKEMDGAFDKIVAEMGRRLSGKLRDVGGNTVDGE